MNRKKKKTRLCSSLLFCAPRPPPLLLSLSLPLARAPSLLSRPPRPIIPVDDADSDSLRISCYTDISLSVPESKSFTASLSIFVSFLFVCFLFFATRLLKSRKGVGKSPKQEICLGCGARDQTLVSICCHRRRRRHRKAGRKGCG